MSVAGEGSTEPLLDSASPFWRATFERTNSAEVNMVGVVQWQSTGLWFRALWVRVPSPTPDKGRGSGVPRSPTSFFHNGASPSGKARDFDSLTRWFESSRPSQPLHRPRAFFIFDPIAQPAEQLPFKQWVRGSNPRRVTNSSQVFACGEFFLCKNLHV